MTDWDDDDFVELTAPTKGTVPLRVSFAYMGRNASARLSIRLDEATALELGGHHYAVKFNPKVRVLRIVAQDTGRWEMVRAPRGKVYILRVPVPAGLVASKGDPIEPEFYVDTKRSLIDIELPPDFGALKMIAGPSKEAPVSTSQAQTPAKSSTEEIVDAGVRQRSCRIGDHFLTAQEGDLLRLLARRDLITRDAAMMATADPSNPDDNRDGKLIDVLIHKLREKLNPVGLYISTVHGEGWRIPRELRSKLIRLIEQSDAS